jgi:transposase
MRIAVLGIDLAKNIFHLYGGDEHGRRALQAGESVEARGDGRQSAALRDRHGGMFDVASLGQALSSVGSRGPVDPSEFRPPLCQGQQERRARCGSNLRGVEPTEHAFRTGEDGRATGRLGAASGRERLVRWRTALINQIRGIMGERGIVVAQGSSGWPRPPRRDRRSHKRADRPVAWSVGDAR